MTPSKVLESAEAAINRVRRMDPDLYLQNDGQFVEEHMLSMLERLPGLLEEGRIEKAMRWLGFMQGAAWGIGAATVDELKDDSKPQNHF